MEEYNLLLIATAYEFMQLKKPNKQRKHHWWVNDIDRNRLQQGASHYLIKEVQFDGEKFDQYFRLRESKIPPNGSVSSGGLAVKHPALGVNGRRFEPRKRSKLFQGLISRLTKSWVADHVKWRCRLH